jgi:hypothetical protein
MARIFIDGFESNSLDLWGTGSGVTVASTSGLSLSGDYCLELTGANDYIVLPLSSSRNDIYLAFKWRPTNSGANQGVVSFLIGSSPQLCLFANNGSMSFRFYRYAVTPVSIAESAAGMFAVGTTYFIEVYAKVQDSGGRAVLKVDGKTLIDFTGDTSYTGTATFDSLRFGCLQLPDLSAATSYAYFDDVILDDAEFPGYSLIQAIKPDSAGNSSQWSTSVSTPNWQCVDEIPYSDTDYVYVNANDQTDTYGFGSLVGSVSSIKCLQAQTRIVKEGASTPTKINMVVRTNSTDYASSDITVPTALQSLFNIWSTNPSSTGIPWDVTAVNALEAGIKSKA